MNVTFNNISFMSWRSVGRGNTYLLVSDFNMENIKYIRLVGILSRR